MAPTLARSHSGEQDRRLKARLDLVVASLWPVALVNPIWAAMFVIPFFGPLPIFGVVTFEAVALIVALHTMTAVAAFAVQRWAIAHKPAPRRLLTVLAAFQTVAGAVWAATAALCWVEGNDANNTLVALIIVANMWALVLTRGYHPVLFGIGLAVMLAAFWSLALTSEGQAATLFVFLVPVFAAYAWLMGVSSRDRVDQLLNTRFALEDMTADLEIARAEAVAKSEEADAASASKSAFVANMSHELRTPLNAILGFSEIIERAAVGPDISTQYRAYGHDIHQSGKYLLSLINDMLDLAKIEAGKMDVRCQVIDGAQAIDAAAKIVANRMEQKSQTLALNVDTGVEVYADDRALTQILINLLSNAAKFAPEGSTIELACRSTPAGGIRLSIADCGPGIPEDKIQQLFRPFSRVDNTYEHASGGTGLGLALVRGLVNLHGGRVWLENRSTGGLIAYVDLPGREIRAVA